MGWRTLIIRNPARLSYAGGYLQVFQDKVTRIFMDELKTLVVESNQVTITSYLMAELVKRNVMTIFCDHKHLPVSALQPLNGTNLNAARSRAQADWSDERKEFLWQEIVKLKIDRQMSLLTQEGIIEKSDIPESFKEVENGDSTNREAVAAKFYFQKLFGSDFHRREETPVTAALDYGYAVLLAAFCQEITAHGYLTQFGVHHCNVHNFDNLGSDLMEPFRILIDRKVRHMDFKEFGPDQKKELVALFHETISFEGKEEPIYTVISYYCDSVFRFMSERTDSLICYVL